MADLQEIEVRVF